MLKYEAKTKPEDIDIESFLAAVTPADRQIEARHLVNIFAEVTAYQPRVWAGSIVGFGRYAYRYESGHEGLSLATGFAPRKADLSIYIPVGFDKAADLLARLGKHRAAKACLYIRRLEAVDEAVLRDLIRFGLEDLRRRWTVTAR